MFESLVKRSDAPPASQFRGGCGTRDSAVVKSFLRPSHVEPRRLSGLRGFTLLELLIVLLLMSLLAAIAAPNLVRLYSSVERQTERDYILDQFAGLGRMALRHGRGYVVMANGPTAPEAGDISGSTAPQLLDTGTERYFIDLPEGWTIDLSHPLVIRLNGVCLGAQLTLLYDGKVEARLALQPPYCRISSHA